MALPSFGKTLTKFAVAALGAAAIAAPAQAGAVIGFETEYEMPFGSGDTYNEGGYKWTFESYFANSEGTAVGQTIDGPNSRWTCEFMACPTNADGYFYAAFNDSIAWLSSETTNAVFKIKSLEASFIGMDPNLASYPIYAGLLRIQGFKADGSWMTQDLRLDGPGANGFSMGTYNLSGAFANTEFVQAAFFGFTCGTTGSCTAFTSNSGQFALDNVTLVPEPASAAIFGLGLMGLLAGARRRKA